MPDLRNIVFPEPEENLDELIDYLKGPESE
jgi:hypothetical protein